MSGKKKVLKLSKDKKDLWVKYVSDDMVYALVSNNEELKGLYKMNLSDLDIPEKELKKIEKEKSKI